MAKEKNLTSILNDTITGIESHKGQIIDIYDRTRNEMESLTRRIAKTGDELKEHETKRVQYENEVQTLKKKLAEASKHYRESEIEKAYEKLVNLENKRAEEESNVEWLMVEREQLITKENHLRTMFNQAEHYTYAIGAALAYLSQELKDIAVELDDFENEKLIGVKVIKAHEIERRRISMELHDGPLQELSATMYNTVVAEKLVNRDPEEAIQNIKKIRQDLKRTMSDIRQVIFDIRPMALDDHGLVGATDELLTNLKMRNIINAEFSIKGEPLNFPTHTQVAIFRIIQESLMNAAHHGEVKTAKVAMCFTPKALEVMIEDKGKGFDPEKNRLKHKEAEDHFGIISMRERAELVGADFKIVSKIGKGTTVSLIVPYES